MKADINDVLVMTCTGDDVNNIDVVAQHFKPQLTKQKGR